MQLPARLLAFFLVSAVILLATTTPAMITIRWIDPNGQPTAPIQTPRIRKTDAEWRPQLTPEQYRILRHAATEAPFCGVFHDNKKDGLYTCAGCGLPLFASNAKFDSGTGWPSFFQPIATENITARPDNTHGMRRTEILCARCEGHLGHVFPDGPKPTRLRYCLNSASLNFINKSDYPALSKKSPQ